MDETERANMTPEERMLDNEIEFQRAQSSAYCCSFCCVVRSWRRNTECWVSERWEGRGD